MYSFSILTLLFRISEKVATPTSVVLMSANSMVGFFWRRFMDDAISQVISTLNLLHFIYCVRNLFLNETLMSSNINRLGRH